MIDGSSAAHKSIMTTALHPAVHTGHSFPWLWRTSRVAEKGLTMIPVVGNMHDIQKGATLVVHKPQHRDVTCLQGALWITHDGDTKDIVLDAGEHYEADRPTRMLIHALENARIRLA